MTLVRSIGAMLVALAIPTMGPNALWAASEESRPSIRILYGYPEMSDSVARLISAQLAQTLKAEIVFENVPAGHGNIAADRVANSAPDGRTLYIAGAPTLAINFRLDDSLSYSPVRDFAPVAALVRIPHMLIIHKGVAAANLTEFLELARAQSGRFSYGHLGIGSVVHLATEQLKLTAKVNLRPVSYKTSAALMQDLHAGRIHACLCDVGIAMPLVRLGSARVVAISSARRLVDLPRVPTFSEAGLPQMQFASWLGMLVPAGTPRPRIEELNGHLVRVLASPAVRAALSDVTMEPIAAGPEALTRIIDQEITKWTAVIRDTGVELAN